MVGRRIISFIGGIVVRDAKRDLTRTQSSLRYHTRRVVTRPIRTSLTIVFMTVLVGFMYTLTNDPTAVAAIDTAGDDPVSVFFAVMPPLPILLLIGVAMVVLVPIALISQGVTNDRRWGRGR